MHFKNLFQVLVSACKLCFVQNNRPYWVCCQWLYGAKTVVEIVWIWKFASQLLMLLTFVSKRGSQGDKELRCAMCLPWKMNSKLESRSERRKIRLMFDVNSFSTSMTSIVLVHDYDEQSFCQSFFVLKQTPMALEWQSEKIDVTSEKLEWSEKWFLALNVCHWRSTNRG